MPKFLLFYDIITFILFFGVKMNYLPICSFSSGGGQKLTKFCLSKFNLYFYTKFILSTFFKNQSFTFSKEFGK